MCAGGELENVSRCSRAQLSGWSRVSVVRDCDPPTRAPVCVLPATPMGLFPQAWGSPPRHLPFLPAAGDGGGLAIAALALAAVCPSAGIGEGA